MENEIWKDIFEFEGLYQVSNLGRIKRLPRFVNYRHGKLLLKEKLLRNGILKKGYAIVILPGVNFKKTLLVHRLVATAFIENKNHYPQINHKNGVKLDNHISNLEWVTNQQNAIHAHKVLKTKVGEGERHRSNKLKSSQVLEIIGMYDSGEYTYKEIGKIFDVSDRTIGSIVNRKTWNSLKEQSHGTNQN